MACFGWILKKADVCMLQQKIERTTSRIHDVDDARYYRDYDKYLTASQLKTFADCPWLADFQRRHPDTKEDTDALYFGRAAHVCTLEGKNEFLRRFNVGGEPINPKTGKAYGPTSQRFIDWIHSLPPGTDHIAANKAEMAIELSSSVHSHDMAGELLKYGKPEVCFRGSFDGIPVQSKIDWLGDGYICDLKTCQNINLFRKQFYSLRYNLQAAFYKRIVQPHMPEARFYFIAVEKTFPYVCGVFYVTQDTMQHAMNDLDSYLLQWKEAVQTDNWITRFEGVHHI